MESLHLYLDDVKQRMMPFQEKVVGEQQQIDDLENGLVMRSLDAVCNSSGEQTN